MSSTHTDLHFHIVFATKHREPTIVDPWRLRLHEYLGGTVRSLGGVSLAVGGVEDHVHLLVGLRPTQCLADFVRDLKRASSHWFSRASPVHSFAWQEGYGAFSVSASMREVVRRYIARQVEHHRRRKSREEYVLLLRRSGVDYDERYVD